jgi:nickel/cobalt transporter (NiCoT) family protein
MLADMTNGQIRLTNSCAYATAVVSMRGDEALDFGLLAATGRGVSMRTTIVKLFNDQDAELRDKVVAIFFLLVLANLLAWIWALIAFHDYPVLVGTAFLAYTFGLRHAVDADHIAAIDNVTRKLMQEGKRPVGVGFFFSLGHSTVVVLASAAIAVTTTALEGRFESFKVVGGVIGTLVSVLFLFLVAAANLLILISVYRTFQHVRLGGAFIEEDLNHLLAQRGFLGRLFRPMFRLVTRSWQMYPLGFLFGLGFDTATEIGLLGISAAEASRGLPIWTIMVFSALFTAGMSLIDTTDGILMLGAYGWAFAKPIRKLYYNLTITFVSVLVAVLIGGIEALGLLAGQLNLEGPFWSFIGVLNDNFGSLGYLIIAIFVASWLVSIAVYRLGRFDSLECAPR